MKITVLFFSVLRDLAGTDRSVVECPEESCSVSEAVEIVYRKYPALRDWDGRTLVALNCRFAEGGETVREGDELALMPPVQGG